jgi:hypothetical protein
MFYVGQKFAYREQHWILAMPCYNEKVLINLYTGRNFTEPKQTAFLDYISEDEFDDLTAGLSKNFTPIYQYGPCNNKYFCN